MRQRSPHQDTSPQPSGAGFVTSVIGGTSSNSTKPEPRAAPTAAPSVMIRQQVRSLQEVDGSTRPANVSYQAPAEAELPMPCQSPQVPAPRVIRKVNDGTDL